MKCPTTKQFNLACDMFDRAWGDPKRAKSVPMLHLGVMVSKNVVSIPVVYPDSADGLFEAHVNIITGRVVAD